MNLTVEQVSEVWIIYALESNFSVGSNPALVDVIKSVIDQNGFYHALFWAVRR